MKEVRLELRFSERDEPFLLDVSALLYDLVLAHDFSVLISERIYSEYSFDKYFWYRNGRPLANEHRVRTVRIVKQSPMLLEVVIPSLGAAWILVQILEKVQNWGLTREKLELEVQKLRDEETARRHNIADQYVRQLDEIARSASAQEIESKLIDRLNINSIRLEAVEIRVEKSSNDDRS